jgi:hypothetical protein
MFHGLEGFIFIVPFIYLAMYLIAYLYTRHRFP